MVPENFINRVTALAVVAGHVGAKIARNGQRGAAAENVLCPFFRRIGCAWVACAKKDVKEQPLLNEILTPIPGGYRLAVDMACTNRFADFWSGHNFSSDRTVAGVLSLESLTPDPLLDEIADPFVMQNLSSFMGRRGLGMVRKLLGDDSNKIVSCIVGPAEDVFFFAEPEIMKALVPFIFSRCRTSDEYKNYSRGSFAPVEVALRFLRSANKKS